MCYMLQQYFPEIFLNDDGEEVVPQLVTVPVYALKFILNCWITGILFSSAQIFLTVLNK
jgi:hypothetical protein